jgi:hypothetical protein
MAARNWTPEQRRRQAEAIRRWSPWEQSTWPRTEQGKADASRNGWKGGHREILRGLSRALSEQRRALAEFP